MKIPFKQVDVFTSKPFLGNPVAVILDGNHLETSQMQSIANWTNLSETTFICSPTSKEADYRLRIFTPQNELPFAGHPTLGSAWAFLESGKKPRTSGRLIQECGKGLIDLKIVDQNIFFALPKPAISTPDDGLLDKVASALRVGKSEIIHASIVDVGIVWFTIQLSSAQKVISIQPDMSLLSALGNSPYTGVTIFGLYEFNEKSNNSSSSVEVRSFAPAVGVPEDPVCGSGNGCVAAMIRHHEILDTSSYVASQGRILGRNGRVMVEFDDDGTIWLGGNAVTCIDGYLYESSRKNRNFKTCPVSPFTG